MSKWNGTKRFLPSLQTKPEGKTSIDDIAMSTWFGPLQPVKPSAPASFRPRQRQYMPGENQIWEPKGDDPISFEVLRALAKNYDLLRIVIESFKDQICYRAWDIRIKTTPGTTEAQRQEKAAKDPVVQELKAFFESPDGYHDFSQWLRMWVEDMIVLDAASLYLERDLSGKIASIHPLDGATINRLIDDRGFTPPAPNPAYQQIIYGTPVWDFTTNDLVYAMRNERNDSRYGFSTVEQLLPMISLGMRREQFQLLYYTSGNMPEAIAFCPPGTPPEQIKELQDSFDASYAGDLAKRRRLTFVPSAGDGKTSLIFPKEPLLKDEMDEWIIKVLCYGVGVSPQPFLKAMNRASAEESNDSAKETGLQPTLDWVASVINNIISNKLELPDYEFAWNPHREADVKNQMETDTGYAKVGIIAINEVRKSLGKDPFPQAEANLPCVISPQYGALPIDGSPQSNAPAPVQPQPDKLPPSGGNAAPPVKEKSNQEGNPTEKFAKTTHGNLRRDKSGKVDPGYTTRGKSHEECDSSCVHCSGLGCD